MLFFSNFKFAKTAKHKMHMKLNCQYFTSMFCLLRIYDTYTAAYIDSLKDALYSLAILILEASKDAFEIHAIVAYLKYLPTC